MATKKPKTAASLKSSYPSMVATKRAFNLSEFAFYGISGKNPLFSLNLDTDAQPVTVRREVFCSNNSAAATKEEDRGKPNPQALDFAVLPPGTDTLLIEGTVLACSESMSLHSCNSEVFEQIHKDFREAFVQAGGMLQLAERYLMNMVNGVMLFRNRLGSDIRCAVRCNDLTVEVAEQDLCCLGALTLNAVTNEAVRKQLAALAQVLADALSGVTRAQLFEVRCSVVMGVGQEVYPSQEFLLEVIESKSSASSNRGYKDGRKLARALRNDGLEQMAFHARKASNALRTIDNWWPDATRALPVEPFGVDRSTQSAMRKDNATFYGIVMTMEEMAEQLKAGTVTPEALYTMAVFLRGGVFSKSDKAEKPEKAEEGDNSAQAE